MIRPRALSDYDLDNSIVFGYYGGGNFGDELLLSVLVQQLTDAGFDDISYAYLDRDMHELLRHASGATPVFGNGAILRRAIRSRNVLVGGGGHWGLDMNRTVLMLSAMLFVMRVVLRKRVFLVGVGYYDSTSRVGRIAAWLAGRFATEVLARDPESSRNFSRVNARTVLDRDLAHYLPLDGIDRRPDAAELAEELQIDGSTTTVLVGVRRLRHGAERYQQALEAVIRSHPDIRFVATTFEPRSANPTGWQHVLRLSGRYPNVTAFDLHTNPLALVGLLARHRDSMVVVAPQYHAQLTAYLVGVPSFPICYDNKVVQLRAGFGDTAVFDMNGDLGPALDAFVERTSPAHSALERERHLHSVMITTASSN